LYRPEILNYDLAIQNARIVKPGGVLPPMNVYCSNGKIAAFSSPSNALSSAKTVDAKGLYLMPGLIEPHVHLGPFNGVESDMESETRSALGGGITTIMNFVTVKGSLPREIERQQKIISERSLTDVGLIGVIMNQQHINELEECFRLGVVSFKHYMSKPEFEKFLGWSYPDEGQILESFTKIARLGGQAMVHPENYEIIARKIEEVKASGKNSLSAWEEARPWYCEYDHMMTAVLLSSIAKVSLYLVHVSIGSFPEVAKYAERVGVVLRLETNPAYLYFTKDDNELGILGKVNPPIRGKEEREALWEGIRSGQISCIGSDHIACNKQNRLGGGDIWTAVPGLHGLEMMLPIMLSEGFHKRGITMERIAEVTSANTAAIHGLPGKGRIEIGSDADFCLFDPSKEVKVTQSMMHDGSDYSLFEGRLFKGWPMMTVSSGEITMQDGEIYAKRGRGKALHCCYSPSPTSAGSPR
jgi:dihydroorotase-like cyclic amidohydrolase